LSQYLDLRVQAELAKGRADDAFVDAQCAFRVANAFAEEPLLISALVRVAQCSIAGQTIWHGIASHQWSDVQLQEFQRLFNELDLFPGLITSLEGERAWSSLTFDSWTTDRTRFVREFSMYLDTAKLLGSFDFPDRQRWLVQGVPAGWIRQNQAANALMVQGRLDRTRYLATNSFAAGFFDALRESNILTDVKLGEIQQRKSPYEMMALIEFNGFTKTDIRVVRANQTARMAAVGCALERYYLEFGRYPDSLAELAPRFVKETPQDLVDGKPLRYSRTPSGLFKLWSIGSDGKDDGGLTRSSTKLDGKILDWVWPY
jgi:hypothetical protein